MNWRNKIYKLILKDSEPVSYEVVDDFPRSIVNRSLGYCGDAGNTTYYIRPCDLTHSLKTGVSEIGRCYRFIKTDMKEKLDNYIKLI